MSLAVRSARTLALRLLNVALQIPTSIVLARLLGVEGKGAYTLLTLVPWMTAFLCLASQDTAFTWLLSSRQSRLRPLLAWGAVFVMVIAPLAAAVYVWGVAPRVMHEVPPALIATSTLLIPIVLLRGLLQGIILGYERVEAFSAYYVLTSLLILAFVALWVAVLGRGLPGALTAFLLAHAVMIPLGALWFARDLRRRPPAHEAADLTGAPLAQRALAYGLKGHVASLLVTFNQRFDVVLMGALSNTTQIGLYGVAVAMAEGISHIPMSVHLNLFPRVAAEGDVAGARRLPRAFRMTVVLSVALGLVLLLLGRPLLALLYGEAFLPAFRSLVFLLPGVVAMGCATVFESYFSGVNRREFQSYSVGIAFVVSLALDVWLIPRWGAVGAAIASTASYVVQMVVSIVLGRRVSARFGLDYLRFGAADLRDLARAARGAWKPRARAAEVDR